MASWNGVITNVGNQLLAEWVNEKTLHFDRAAAGSGTVPVAGLMGQTSLVSQKQEVSLVSGGSVEEGVRLKLQVVAPTTEYTLNQFGIWASVDGGSSVMIALYQTENGVPIPSKANSPEFLYTFYAVISVSNEGEWSITVDSSAVLTRDMLGAPSGVASLDSSGKVPAGQLPEMDFIPDTEKGKANGVATLGADGKLTDGQVPAASKVGYTNNGQTSVSGALDALFQGLADGTITSQVITATSSGWSGDIPTQTLNVTGITADTMCWVGLDDSANAQQRDAARKAVMSPTAQGTNSITLTCDGVQPTVDLPILIYISGGAS